MRAIATTTTLRNHAAGVLSLAAAMCGFLLAITDLYLVKLIAPNFGGNYGLHLIKPIEYIGYSTPQPDPPGTFLARGSL
jgi:hypothetical protein